MLNFDPVNGPTLESLGRIDPSRADVEMRLGQDGYASQGFSQRGNPLYERRIHAAASLMADCLEGRCEPFLFRQAMRPTAQVYVTHLNEAYPGIFDTGGSRIGLRETMSTSDYSALTVDILDRMLYGYYTAAPITNMPLVKKVPLRDFRLVARYAMDGATTPWSAQVFPPGTTAQSFPTVPHGPGEPPTERAMQQAARESLSSTARVTYQPQLFQGKMAVNWRALVNDDLGIFQDMTNRLAIGGRRTIYQYITSLYVDTSGPHATLYSSTFSNLITTTYGAASNNPPLSIQGIMDGYNVLAKMLDSDGQPITFDGTLYLWYGPSLHTTAMSLLKAIQADISVGGGTTNAQGFPSQRLRMENWPANGLVPIEDKYIPLTCTASGIKNTMWGLTYAPESQARPSLELGFLTGFDSPQLFQKLPNTARAGGGVDPMLGDWYSMDTEYKGVLVMGGTQIDGRSTVASTGAGS